MDLFSSGNIPGVAIAFLPRERTIVFKVLWILQMFSQPSSFKPAVGVLIPRMIWGGGVFYGMFKVCYGNLSYQRNAPLTLGLLRLFVYTVVFPLWRLGYLIS